VGNTTEDVAGVQYFVLTWWCLQIQIKPVDEVFVFSALGIDFCIFNGWLSFIEFCNFNGWMISFIEFCNFNGWMFSFIELCIFNGWIFKMMDVVGLVHG